MAEGLDASAHAKAPTGRLFSDLHVNADDSALPPAVRRMVLIDRATMDYQMEGVLCVGAVLVGLLFTFLLWHEADRRWLSVWLGGYLLIVGSEITLLFVKRGFAPKTTREALRSLHVRLRYCAAHGVWWACASVLFFDPQSAPTLWILLGCLSIICGGSMLVALIGVWHFLVILLPTMLSFQAVLLYHGAGNLVVSIPIVTVLLVVLARILNGIMSRMLGAHYRSAEQLNDLHRRFSNLAQELEAKTRFISVLSHDLRQPVHAMGLLAHALDKHVADAQGRSLLSGITSAVDSLLHSFESLLNLTRLEANAVKPRIVRVSLQAVFDRLESEFGPQARQHGIFLKFVPTRMMGYSDANMLHCVLGNFVSNALSHCPAGRVVVACRRAREQVDMLVFDTGPGIPAQRLAEVFLPFHRLATPIGAIDDTAHAGLGLAIAMRTAQALGSQIGVRSNLGRGSCFWLRVPRATGAMASPAEPATWSEPGRTHDVLSGCRIAFLDDDQVLREQTVRLLERWGCHVHASSGAADFLRQNGPPHPAPHLVVVDYQLGAGEMDGISAVLELRTRLAKDIPALVISADTSNAASTAAANAGLKLVNKPVKPAQLRTILSELRRHGGGANSGQ